MCLGIPGKIAEVRDESGTVMAHADFPGEMRKVCLAYLPDMKVGDHTLVHAAFALTRLDEEAALTTLELPREYDIPDTPAAISSDRAAAS